MSDSFGGSHCCVCSGFCEHINGPFYCERHRNDEHYMSGWNAAACDCGPERTQTIERGRCDHCLLPYPTAPAPRWVPVAREEIRPGDRVRISMIGTQDAAGWHSDPEETAVHEVWTVHP